MPSKIRILLILIVIAFAVKAPFAAQRFRLYPDAIAYVNVARAMAAGEGFTSTLKLNYFDQSPVTHCALSDWPPLYPLLAGMLIKAGLSEVSLQVTNALFASAAAALVFLIADRLFDRGTAILAGGFAAISLNLFRAGLTAISDPLALMLALSAVLCALTAGGRPSLWLAAGALAGAAYLARYPNGLLLPALMVFALTGKAGARCVFACAAGFALPTAPCFLWKATLYGSPLYSVQNLHYATSSFSRASWLCYAQEPTGLTPDPAAIWRNTRYLALTLFRTGAGLQFLCLGLPVLLATERARAISGGRGLLLASAAMNFAVYALTPSLPAAQGVRFLLLSHCLLLPFCAAGLVRLLSRKRIVARTTACAACLAAATVCVTGMWSPFNSAFEMRPLPDEVAAWAHEHLPPGTVVASNNPWLVSHRTGLPAAALPHNLDDDSLQRFFREYQVGALVVLASSNRPLTLETIERSPLGWDVVRLGRARCVILEGSSDRYSLYSNRAMPRKTIREGQM